MKNSDKKNRGRQEEDVKTPQAPVTDSESDPAQSPGRKGSPRFRLVRLDGRDTLKYEDTADK
jgi:hypothetical protein